MLDVYVDEQSMLDNMFRPAQIDDLLDELNFYNGELPPEMMNDLRADLHRDLRETVPERPNIMRETQSALWLDRLQFGSEILDDFAYWRQKKALKKAVNDKYKQKYLAKAKDKVAAKLAKRNERAKKLDEERSRLVRTVITFSLCIE